MENKIAGGIGALKTNVPLTLQMTNFMEDIHADDRYFQSSDSDSEVGNSHNCTIIHDKHYYLDMLDDKNKQFNLWTLSFDKRNLMKKISKLLRKWNEKYFGWIFQVIDYEQKSKGMGK